MIDAQAKLQTVRVFLEKLEHEIQKTREILKSDVNAPAKSVQAKSEQTN